MGVCGTSVLVVDYMSRSDYEFTIMSACCHSNVLYKSTVKFAELFSFIFVIS